MTLKNSFRFVLALSAGLLSSTATFAEVLKVSTFLPPNHTFNRALEAWSEVLKEKTGGELSLELFTSGQLGPPNRQYELAKSGVVDLTVVLHSATPGRFPMTAIAGSPLSYPTAGQTSEVTSRRLTELAPEYLAAEHAGTKILWMAMTPALKLHTTDKEITAVDDVKGLRVRYSGKVFQKILENIGASPVPVAPAETGDALSKGIVDGAMFPFEATKAFDLATSVHFSLEPGLASATFAVVMNQEKYDSLSEELQKIISDTTGPDMGQKFGKMWDEGEAEGRAYMIDAGRKITQLSDAEISKFQGLVSPIIEESLADAEAKGLPARAFYEAYTK